MKQLVNSFKKYIKKSYLKREHGKSFNTSLFSKSSQLFQIPKKKKGTKICWKNKIMSKKCSYHWKESMREGFVKARQSEERNACAIVV
jgi:hypothetical protein